MDKFVGIRREDKNIWERRVPIIPSDMKWLNREHGIDFITQPSDIRVFKNKEYAEVGSIVDENINSADLIVAVKEIPVDILSAGKTYVYFSHTIKGQDYNMAMLKKLMDLKCNLIDYERIVNEKNQRLIFFGKYAGYAGMIETLHAYGKKLKLQGIDNPFEEVKQAFEYSSVEEAKNHIQNIGIKFLKMGIPSPGIFGFTGYGNVSKAAQEILDLLPVKTITPGDLESQYDLAGKDANHLYKVVFGEKDMVKPKSGPFILQDYYDHPEKYSSQFHKYLPYLSVIVNCIYWTEAYPRLLTKQYLANNPDIKLSLIGDISVDIDGSIEITNKATYPDHPSYTYNPHDNTYHEGIIKEGISIMAIDNLPCEFPKESSSEFSKILKEFIPGIINANFDVPFKELSLPEPIKKALIVQNGELTDDYKYMSEFIK